MSGTEGLKRGFAVIDTGGPITVPVGDGVMGRVFDVTGQPVDERGPVKAEKRYPIHRPPPPLVDQSTSPQVLSTGIKVIDLDLPVPQGRQGRRVRRRRRRQDRRHHGADQQHRQAPRRRLGVRRRRRAHARGQRPLSRDVAGRRHQPAGSRRLQDRARLRADERAARRAPARRAERASRSPSTSATSENQDVLLFIDNIFRFSQAGSEVSALLGRTASAVGYQPTLAAEMGVLQERITSTKKGSITSFQAVYVPADDLTDPAPATTFAHLDATIVLERSIAELGIYPAVDPLASTSRALAPEIVGEEHYDVARRVQRVLQRFKDLQDIIAILGMDELSPEDKLTVYRARQDSALPQPAVQLGAGLHRPRGPAGAGRRHGARLQGDPRRQARQRARRQLLHEGRDRGESARASCSWSGSSHGRHAETRNRHARRRPSSPRTCTWSRCRRSTGRWASTRSTSG